MNPDLFLVSDEMCEVVQYLQDGRSSGLFTSAVTVLTLREALYCVFVCVLHNDKIRFSSCLNTENNLIHVDI